MESKTTIVAAHMESLDHNVQTGMKSTTTIKDAAEANTRHEKTMTLREAVRLYPKAVFFCFVLSLAIIMEGYDTALVGSLWAQPAFQEKYGRRLANGSYQLDSRWQSALSGVVQIGSIFGYYLSGIVIERFGYKMTMQVCLGSIIAFIFVVFFAPNVATLVAGEGLLGIPWGIIQTLTTTYAAEVTPIALRAYVTSYINLCWVIGQLLASGVLRGVLPLTTQWAYRIPFALQWIWPLPIMLTVAFAPDSPWWLVRRGRIADARKALLGLTNQRNVEYDVDAVIAMITNTIEQERVVQMGSSYTECFKGVNLRRTEITCVAGAVPFFSGLSFASQGVYFLSSAGLATKSAYNVGIGQSAIGFVGVLCSWILVHRFGRRTLYLTGYSISLVLLILIGILGCIGGGVNTGALWATGALMMIFVFVYDTCLGPLAYVVVAEMPSSDLRNKTVALARIFLNLLSFAASWLNPALVNPSAWNLRGKGAFVWTVPCCLCLVWCFYRLPESRGRTFGELDDLFYQKISARKFSKSHASIAVAESELPGDKAAN